MLAGNIIVRQRGTQYHAGPNVRIGRDHTFYARSAGRVDFAVKGPKNRRFVSVVRRLKRSHAIAHESPGAGLFAFWGSESRGSAGPRRSSKKMKFVDEADIRVEAGTAATAA